MSGVPPFTSFEIVSRKIVGKGKGGKDALYGVYRLTMLTWLKIQALFQTGEGYISSVESHVAS